jgi:hypothetical protein
VRLLTLIRAEHPDSTTSGCLFVAVPDVYRDHAATLALWRRWRDQVWGFDMPLAFVVQNEAHRANVPWRDFRTVWRGCAYYTGAIFVGGDTAWKMGDEAAAIVRVAKSLGLWTYAGRCNSLARIRHAKAIGADSVDGGGFSQFRKHLGVTAFFQGKYPLRRNAIWGIGMRCTTHFLLVPSGIFSVVPLRFVRESASADHYHAPASISGSSSSGTSNSPAASVRNGRRWASE